ncbi:MAG: OmpH family outer membrane protein [Proteobacteria bacterium]|nr:OmpH family outer membrane protein [Pseudomonadota bacterium]
MKSVSIKTIRKSTVLFLLLVSSGTAYSENKIGFVDMETLINDSPQILIARMKISQEFELQNEAIKQKEIDFELLENRITSDGAMMSLPELTKLQERARILERQIRRAKEDLKDAINIQRSQALNKIQLELKEVVEKYAIDNQYDAILVNAILYVSDEINITDEILTILREKSNSDEN